MLLIPVRALQKCVPIKKPLFLISSYIFFFMFNLFLMKETRLRVPGGWIPLFMHRQITRTAWISTGIFVRSNWGALHPSFSPPSRHAHHQQWRQAFRTWALVLWDWDNLTQFIQLNTLPHGCIARGTILPFSHLSPNTFSDFQSIQAQNPPLAPQS